MKDADYIICSYPRSGTNLLRHLLTVLQLGAPQEISKPVDFSKPQASINAEGCKWKHNFLRTNYWTNPNHEFCFYSRTVWWFQLKDVFAELRRVSETDFSITDSDLFEHLYPGIKYIYLSRNDKVRLAISEEKAVQIGEFEKHNKDAESYDSSGAIYDFGNLVRRLLYAVHADIKWESFFEELAISPLRVCYEDLVADKVGVLRKIASFLGVSTFRQDYISPTSVKKALSADNAPVKQSDSVNDEWAAQFHDDLSQIIKYTNTRNLLQ